MANPVPLNPDPPSSWTNITPASGQPNPPARYLSSMAFDPATGYVLLFGGYGELGLGPWVFFQDTWSFSAGHWTELVANTSCTATTCPSPRAGAMLAYDASEHGMILFGGYTYTPSYEYLAFSDTWLFSGGHWTNLSASSGTPPSPRFDGSMVWDSYDNYVLLFGGMISSLVSYGDTWKFTGTWTNITSTVGGAGVAPAPRDGAAIADEPTGYIMLFGGEDAGVLYTDVGGSCHSVVAFWFHAGSWTPMATSLACVNRPAAPAPESSVTSLYPPCGRMYAGLGWSPPNNRFVLFGGIGPSIESSCSGFDGFLNDSWTYQNSPGGPFYFKNATDLGYVGDPSPREEMGYAADFTDKYFEIFGGYPGLGSLNDTWRFHELVHADLTGPSEIDTNSSHLTFNVPFTVTGYGGSGFLNYTFSIHDGKTGNSLQGSGCSKLTNPNGNYSLPYDGVATIFCTPTASSYNVYRLTVTVFDTHNYSQGARATANWTFTVLPPETAIIYSEYTGFFYTGLDFDDNFSAFLKVANSAPDSVSATFDGAPLTFSQRSSGSFWFDAGPVDMGNVAPGAKLELTATFQNWTLNATYSVHMIDSPAWLIALIELPGNHTVSSGGSGPYNKTWTLSDEYNWNISQAFGFNLPIPLAGGNYSLIPGFTLTSGITSAGNVSLTGSFKFNTSQISLGPASIQITAKISLTGTFALVTEGTDVSGITWVSATAKVAVDGDFSASVPIYGFSIFGLNVGFTLNIDLDPSIALELILVPTTDVPSEIIPGLQVMLSQLLGSFELPLSVSISFGIGIASVAIGGTLSVALAFTLYPSLSIAAGWVNGSLFVSAKALFWSDQWNLLGPGVIYNWTSAAPEGPKAEARPGPGYNNGTGTTWKLDSRYYSTSGYDLDVWNPNGTAGAAVSDIYPYTTVTAAAGYDGSYLYYTNDNPNVPVNQGLEVSALRLNASTNTLSSIPSPTDPGYLLEGPKAATLANGSQFVVWGALPTAEEGTPSPTDLSSLGLHGALYSPANRSWGPTRTFSNWGIVESYEVDASGAGGVVLALIGPTFLVGTSTPEQLVAFDLATGAVLSNVTVVGLSSLLSLDAGARYAVVKSVSGVDSVLNYAAGSTVPVSVSVPANTSVNSEYFVPGTADTLLILYREPKTTELVLYDPSSSSVIAVKVLDQTILAAEGLFSSGTYYLFAQSNAEIFGWTESGGTFHTLSTYAIRHLAGFGLVPVGSDILVYALSTNGNVTAPIVTLSFEEVGAAFPGAPGRPAPPTPTPVSPPPPTVTTITNSVSNTMLYVEYLAVVAAAVVVLLAVIAVVGRKRGGSSRPGPGDGSPPEAPPTPPESGP
jgi:hypothetical protein